MRTLCLSSVATAVFVLLGTAGTIGVAAQDAGQAFDGLFLGTCHFPLSDTCEAGVRTICESDGQTTFGRAYIHTEHCPQTSGPSNTDASMELLFEDGSSLTATYAVTCEPLMPEGPGLITCTPYIPGEVTGGTGIFEGVTGSMTLDPVYGYFDGVDWATVDWELASVVRGTIVVAPVPAG